MLLYPLSGADQAFFFAIPTAKDQCPPGFPSRLEQFADAVHRFQHGRRTAVGIHRSVDPCVAMISCDDPFVRQFTSAYAANNVPERAELIVLFEMHLHSYRARTDVVSKRQRALPIARRFRTAEMLQNRRDIVV